MAEGDHATNGSKESSELSREQIENLAYAIWEARNDGREAPDEDWYEAEAD